ncbi:S9 family peptidase [Flagellimonas sp. CMM7]|uniref:alpha/beta hydrolase family protein n=1 Tax=Flagellimonas sp. CMM7 TaxID=2654676 RepID=UPI0013D59292|nr:phospholipase [Flagellimonas sp. CMM7]UII80962.1 hypothetical protein LV704_05470 [Flagellimonas sp. CMM7]
MKKIKKLIRLSVLLLPLLYSVSSCSVDVEVDEIITFDSNFGDLRNWELLATVSENQLKSLIDKDEPELVPIIANRNLRDIKVYKITYNTSNVDGNTILASGLVIVPKHGLNMPLVSFQHGTIFTNDDAPSSYNTKKLATVFAMALASTNYVVIMPDYLGYGASSNYPHPYEHRETLGSTSFDMIMTVKENLGFIDDLILNDKLFIAGYSEGGYATMALHQHIEENSNLKITMSAPASGAYNKSGFFQQMMQLDEDFNYPGSAMWVVDSYNTNYNLNRNWSAFINEPYAATMESILNPFDYINADIAQNPQDLYTAEFRTGLVNGTDTEYLSAIADNDVFDWTPKYPITLYYASEDNWVFPLNSETAYESMLENGANVSRVIYEGEGHFTAGILYVNDVFELFESNR